MLTTGPETVTLAVAVPLIAIECAPTPGAAQVAPVPRVPVWPLPDESAVVVPEPSLNGHDPAGVGTVAAADAGGTEATWTATQTPATSASAAAAAVCRHPQRHAFRATPGRAAAGRDAARPGRLHPPNITSPPAC